MLPSIWYTAEAAYLDATEIWVLPAFSLKIVSANWGVLLFLDKCDNSKWVNCGPLCERNSCTACALERWPCLPLMRCFKKMG